MKDAAWFERQSAHALEALAENARHHTEEEIERAKRAVGYREEGRLERRQQELNLAA